MTALRLLDHPRHTDHLRLRDGRALTVRFIAPDDGETCCNATSAIFGAPPATIAFWAR